MRDKKLADQDSNLDKQNQNLLCYRYTIGQDGKRRDGALDVDMGTGGQAPASTADPPERTSRSPTAHL